MTTEGVSAEQNHVHRKNERADTDSETVINPQCFPNIVTEDQNKNQGEIKKVAMDILHDEREGSLAEISFARLANGAGGRIGPERFVIRSAVVVTRQPKSARRPQYQ